MAQNVIAAGSVFLTETRCFMRFVVPNNMSTGPGVTLMKPALRFHGRA